LRSTGNTDPFREAFGVDASEQLHRDVDVSIGGPRHDWRGKVVALDYSNRIAAPAKPDAYPGLRSESNLVGVNSHQQEDISRTCPGAADSESGGIRAGACRGVTATARRVGWPDVRTDCAVGQHRGAARLARIGGGHLRLHPTRTGEKAPTPAREKNVRFGHSAHRCPEESRTSNSTSVPRTQKASFLHFASDEPPFGRSVAVMRGETRRTIPRNSACAIQRIT
jgi:hypothetical protein